MTGLIAAWATETALVAWRSFQTNQRPPFPSELAAPVIAFGALGLLGSYRPAATAAAVVGWGLVAATFLNMYQPVTPTASNPTGASPSGSALSGLTKNLGA